MYDLTPYNYETVKDHIIVYQVMGVKKYSKNKGESKLVQH